MKPKSQNKTVQLLKYIEEQLKNYALSKDPKLLHQARVAIKKLKALLSLFKPNNKEQVIKPIKSVFMEMGAIRELQTHIKILKKAPLNSQNGVKLLQGKERELIIKFKKRIPYHLKKLNLLHDKLQVENNFEKKREIKHFLKKEIKKSKEKLKEKKRESLHSFRKHIKKMLYVYQALPATKQKQIKLNSTLLKKMQNKIGKWHDIHSAIEFLRNIKSVSKKYVSSLSKKEKKEFESLLGHGNSFLKKI